MNREEKFIKRLEKEKGSTYKLIGEYVNSSTKVLMKHEVCGYEWKTTPNNLFSTKYGCPKCSGNARRTTGTFKKEVYELVGDEYTVVGEYKNAKTKIMLIHEKCGHTYKTSPDSFINQSTRCPKCSGNLQWTNDKFLKEVTEQVGDEYVFKDKYVNNHTKLRCVHEVCGYEWEISPANFLNKRARCPSCAGNAPLTQEEYAQRVEDMYEGDYEIVGEYKNTVTPVSTKHICGYEWMTSPSNLLRGRRCPRCYRESNGELYVRELLEREEVEFTSQKTFEGCRHIKLLPFDFYLPEINLAIEYDGEQHFRPVNFGGGWEEAKENYEKIVIRDGIKSRYCADNGIPLLRIPYYLTKEEVEETLIKTIQQSRSNAEELSPRVEFMI